MHYQGASISNEETSRYCGNYWLSQTHILYKHTHLIEVNAYLSLFRFSKVTHEERLRNLMVLLNGQGLEVCNFRKRVVECKREHDNSLGQDGFIL